VEILESGILYFVDAPDLADQQLGIADQLKGFGAVLESVFEGRDQALVLGEIVGLVAEVLAEMGDLASGLILDDYPVAGGAGVAACAAIAVGDEVMLGRILAGVRAMREERFGSGGAGVGHGHEFTTYRTDLEGAATKRLKVN
jgi:hypothetical protein